MPASSPQTSRCDQAWVSLLTVVTGSTQPSTRDVPTGAGASIWAARVSDDQARWDLLRWAYPRASLSPFSSPLLLCSQTICQCENRSEASLL